MKTDLERGRSSAFYCTSPASFCSRCPTFVGLSIIFPIVGYAQSNLKAGGTMAVAQFVAIGTDSGMDLQSLVPTGEDCSDNVQIQTLDAFGYTKDSYDWNDWASDNACWVDADWNPISEVTIAPGQGLWVMGSASTQGLQSAGKVGLNDVVVALRAGGTCTGNPFPVNLDLQDVIPEGEDCSDNVQIQTLDAFGYTVDSYDWNDWANDNACWVDADWNPITNVKLIPGQGLWVMGSSASQSLRFPAPEL